MPLVSALDIRADSVELLYLIVLVVQLLAADQLLFAGRIVGALANFYRNLIYRGIAVFVLCCQAIV